MADIFEAYANRTYVERAGKMTFDTALPSAQLLPPSTVLSGSVNVSFPDPLKGNAYIQNLSGPGAQGRSFITLLKQEWSPLLADNPATNARNLPDIVIGSVPAGTDYLDVQVNMSRTTVPDNTIFGYPYPMIPPASEWVGLQNGGSCLIEKLNGFARLFEFVLSGTTVLLRRYQSVNTDGIPWNAANNGSISGWTWGNVSNNMGANADVCILAAPIDNRGPSPTGFDRLRATNNDRANIPGRAYVVPGTSSTSGTYSDTSSFASVYATQYIIHPGRIT